MSNCLSLDVIRAVVAPAPLWPSIQPVGVFRKARMISVKLAHPSVHAWLAFENLTDHTGISFRVIHNTLCEPWKRTAAFERHALGCTSLIWSLATSGFTNEWSSYIP